MTNSNLINKVPKEGYILLMKASSITQLEYFPPLQTKTGHVKLLKICLTQLLANFLIFNFKNRYVQEKLVPYRSSPSEKIPYVQQRLINPFQSQTISLLHVLLQWRHKTKIVRNVCAKKKNLHVIVIWVVYELTLLDIGKKSKTPFEQFRVQTS